MVLFLLALAAGLAALRWDAWRQVDTAERERLTLQVQAIERNVVRQLDGAYAALQALRSEVESGAVPPAAQSREMQVLVDAMPGVRTLLAIDGQGRAVASNRGELIGRNFAERDYFLRARADNDRGTLHLSPPFISVLGVRAMSLTLSVQDAAGGFAGVVTATLDPSYFATAVGAGVYAADMWAAIGHEEGRAMLYEPPQAWPLDADLRRPGTMFSRHFDSGQPTSVLYGPTVVTGQDALMVLRSVRPPSLPLDRVLVLALARDRAAVHAAWKDTTRAYALLWLLMATLAALGLLALQRRRLAEEVTQARADRQRELDQQRVAMALRGADLGTWELDLAHDTHSVNARWLSMLGLPPEQPIDREGFFALVHPEDEPRLKETEAHHLAGEIPLIEAIFRMRHRDGRWIWVLDRGQVTERDPSGHPLRVAGTHLDVTERMQAQQALQDRERQLSDVADALPGPVCHIDRDGVVRFANAACALWLGHGPTSMVGRPASEALGALAAPYAAHIDAVRRGDPGLFEAVVPAAQGPLHALVTLVPDRAADGSVRGTYLVATDVTAPRLASDALRHSEARLRTLLDALATGVVVHDGETRIVDSNPAASQLLGLSRAQMQGKEAIDPDWHFIEDDGSPMALERYPVTQVMTSGHPVRTLVLGIVRPDRDNPVWVLVDALPLLDDAGAVSQVVVTFFDITALRGATERLRLLQAGIERLNDVVLITELAHTAGGEPRIAYANPAFERVTGYTLADVMGRNPNLLQGPGTDRAEAARLGSAVRERRPVHAELVNYTRDRRPYWIEIDIVPVPDASGRVTHMVAVQRDITERRETAERLQVARADLAATLAALPDLLFDVDSAGTVHAVHTQRPELLALPAEEIVGRHVTEIVPPEVHKVVMQAIAEAMAKGASGGQQYALALRGALHWFELSVARKPAASATEPRVIVLARDITARHRAEAERRELEAQLREAQRHEAIGTLASGIAHDFNNIVAGILGNVALARQDVGASHPVADSLAQIERAGLRARSLIRQILAFSRRESARNETVALHDVMRETLELLRATAPAGVRFDAHEHAAPVWVRGDPTQLQQVLMNLCVNAWQAVPEGGGRIEVGLERGDAEVRLWVEDNGVGMDEAVRARIFDPFFTTKAPGIGTGLGLAVVQGIVRSHGGRIEVTSRPGQGTLFEIFLPRADADAGTDSQAMATPQVASAPVPGRGQTVLYVDDDEIMRLVVQRMLERAGWRVIVCSGGDEAMNALAQHGSAIELLVSDMNMPDMSGLELCAGARRLRPALPTIISTGLVSEALRELAVAPGVSRVLAKEELFEQLVQVVAEVLEATPAAGG